MKRIILTTEAAETNPKDRQQILEKSFQEGIISKEEYEKEKEKLMPDIEELDRKIEQAQKEDVDYHLKTSEKPLIFAIIVILILFAGIITYSVLHKTQPKTIEELHILNLQGKLKPEQGYVYKNAYSFITLDNQWYTQLKSPKGTKLYSLAMRYSPRDVKGIQIIGNLDDGFFNNQTVFYNTFDPGGKQLQYVSLAVADFSTHMSRVFEKIPIGACNKNLTASCSTIVTCDDKDKLVLYVKESDKSKVSYKGNCIIVEGNQFDMVKGVDKVLYNLYGIMEKNE